MNQFLTGEALASLAALTFLEIVLGVDNIVFLAMAVHRLPPERRSVGRRIGLGLAMLLRIGMLVGLVWLAHLDIILFHVLGRGITVKDLVLIAGGLFLLAKGTTEIHETLEAEAEAADSPRRSGRAGFVAVMIQIGLINIVFSLDSVITAVGMTDNLPVMIAAVVASTGVMLFAARPVGDFIHHRPTTKMLALSFILLVGVALVADGLGFHLPRTSIYFAIAFSLFVEVLNISASDVPLSDPLHPTNTWRLRKAIDFDFPSGSQLAAGAKALIVPIAPASFRARHAVLHHRSFVALLSSSVRGPSSCAAVARGPSPPPRPSPSSFFLC